MKAIKIVFTLFNIDRHIGLFIKGVQALPRLRRGKRTMRRNKKVSKKRVTIIKY